MSDNNNTLGNNKSDIYMISKMIVSSTLQNEKNKNQKKPTITTSGRNIKNGSVKAQIPTQM